MLRRIAFLLVLAGLWATNAQAAEFGIGLTVNETDTALYVPILISDTVRTEISMGLASGEAELGPNKEEKDQIEAGIGLFFTKAVYEKTQLYYGCRLSYLYQNIETESSGGVERSYSLSGFQIAPTLGFEYFFTPHLSLGGEIELYYQSFDGEMDDGSDSLDADQTYWGTDSRVVIRYYF